MNRRCFGTGNPDYEIYHDTEWAVPSYDDSYLFEMLILEGAQAGLSWETVLKKREAYRTLFHDFDPKQVAEMSDQELEALLTNPAIIRHRGKVFAARTNAQVFLAIQDEFGSFSHYVWRFVGNIPRVNRWKKLEDMPTQTLESQALSKDLKRRGMIFVGPTIMYAFMQAVGMADDHLESCDCNLLAQKNSIPKRGSS